MGGINMQSEYITIIACCIVIVFIGILAIYRKKTGVKDDYVTFLLSASTDAFITYVQKNATDDAKDFDEVYEYVIYVKNFIRKEILSTIKDNKDIPDSAKAILESKFLDDIVDQMIEHNASILQDTFDSVKENKN